ncbi:FAD-dependent oxidoreductase [Gillisia sp. Q332]|uniref:FAD-dependent oxidoreductase n=1 Tax=Gillisia xinjiangensis TaxID=3384765 RepID=UPI00391A9B1C
MEPEKKRKVVVIGGGFAGLATVNAMKGANVEITVIDKSNHHLFQPLLYQVATAALSPGDIAAPIRAIFGKNKKIRVILGEVNKIDTEAKKLYLVNEITNYS